MISRVRHFLLPTQLILLYNALFQPYINYCCMLFSNTHVTYIEKLEKLQKRVVRMIDGQDRFAHTAPIFKKLKVLRLRDMGKLQMMLLMHKKLNGTLPTPLDELFTVFEPLRTTRSLHHFQETFTHKLYCTHTVRWAGPRLWNQVMGPRFPNLRDVPTSKRHIKGLLKQFFFDSYWTDTVDHAFYITITLYIFMLSQFTPALFLSVYLYTMWYNEGDP